jgi:hypothetical protein
MKGNLMYLTSSLARQTAEARWGRGGTCSRKTNRKGAYYFSCSGHGGFVISAKALSPSEYDSIRKYVEPETLTVYVDNFDDRVLLAFHPFRRNAGKMSLYTRGGYRIEKEEIFLLEEDSDWSLAVKFAGIKTEGMTEEAAEKVFYNWYDNNNPAVAARTRVAELRAAGDSDLIVAASGLSDGVVKVWTADQKIHFVKDYSKARDEFGTPWLSRCVIFQMEGVA